MLLAFVKWIQTHSETSESTTYPFEEVCDRKQPLTMKSDTFYAKVVNMLEAVKDQTNSYLTEQLQAAKREKAAATAQTGGSDTAVAETASDGELSSSRGKSKANINDGKLQAQDTPVDKRTKKASE